ncbi:MAG: L-seryl-tRNA(Sec) selenium transferase [Myxococcota bacterium]|nr:L-seryl-tRNA(Sec) selenium transferase [Myxococcota bacterium]
METNLYRQLPQVNNLVDADSLRSEVELYGRDVVVRSCRQIIDMAREEIKQEHKVLSEDELIGHVKKHLLEHPFLYQPVLNATGVILHTNLGRAPISARAWEAMQAAGGYCDLEMDLGTGKRASRQRDVEALLEKVSGAPAGMVINNCAGAILLSLAALAGERPTAISRGHLIEIGGGFRLPTIMEASGSPLLEIGTTNRTHLKDYKEALEKSAGLILLVHRSNFVIEGYVTEPAPQEIIALAKEFDVPVVLDLGSGALEDPGQHGLPAEDTVTQALKQGFDAVCFSADKLLGGPQAGVIVGSRVVIDKLKKHPLARALRCDKVQLAGVCATLDLYARGEAKTQIPIWQMMLQSPEALRARALYWCENLGCGEVFDSPDAVGGGSLPGEVLKGVALALDVEQPEDFLALLRRQEPAIVGHIRENRVLFHPRTILPEDDEKIITGLKAALDA